MNHQQLKSTKLHRAFYSLVQYCPDLSRLEVANVGVVVFCPELNFLGSEMTQDHTRINQMFGRGQRDLKRLRVVKAGLKEKFASTDPQSLSLELLNQWAALHVNTIRMSPFMPCRVSSDPRLDIQKLFNELVEPATVSVSVNKPAALRETLKERFSAPELSKRIRRKIKVKIPIWDREEEIPYGYQNGRMNLITPVVFPKTKPALENHVAKYAVEGESLYQHEGAELGPMQLLVVGQFDGDDQAAASLARRIFDQHKVRLFQRTELQKLSDEITKQGKIIS